MKQVAIIGNANLLEASQARIAKDIGQLIAELNYNLVCGGLGGVMEESCRGFKLANGSGCTIGILPGYDVLTANEFIEIVIPTGLDVGRNQLVVASGFAVIVVGGGAGTLSEIALASQINKPILLMKGSGGWADKLTGEYLDGRQNTRLYHIRDMLHLKKTLGEIELHQVDRTGVINSGHNHADASTP